MTATTPEAIEHKNARRRAKRSGKPLPFVFKPGESKGSPDYRRKIAMRFPVAEMSKSEQRAMLTAAVIATSEMQ